MKKLKTFPLSRFIVIKIFFVIIISSHIQAYQQEVSPIDLSSHKIVIVMRHALAPGFGDPKQFKIGVRKTQRNLSPEGREQAKRAGHAIRKWGLLEAEVFSSQWYRCLDTAELLEYGEVQELPFLNSFFDTPETEEQQTQEARVWLKDWEFAKPVIWVTHQVNIIALTGIVPASGEILFMEWDDDLSLLYRLQP